MDVNKCSIANDVTNFYFWQRDQWNFNEYDYIHIIFGFGMPAALRAQRYYDFIRDHIPDGGIQGGKWQHGVLEEGAECQIRYKDNDRRIYEMVEQSVRELEKKGIFTSVLYIKRPGINPRESGGPVQDYQMNTIKVEWGPLYTKSHREQKVDKFISTQAEFSSLWVYDIQDDFIAAVLSTESKLTFHQVICSLSKFRQNNRLAFSTVKCIDSNGTDLSDQVQIDAEGECTRKTEGAEAIGDDTTIPHEHKGTGALAHIRFKENAFPVDKYKSRWYRDQMMRENERKCQERDDETQAAGKTTRKEQENHMLQKRQDEWKAQLREEEEERLRALKIEYLNSTRPDPFEYDIKEERIYHPLRYARREMGYVDGKKPRTKVHREWQEYTKKYPNALNLFPIGGGSFYNGYFNLKKKDFYHKVNGHWRPIQIGHIPPWSGYGDWYWDMAYDAGLSDERYDSDDNTLSDNPYDGDWDSDSSGGLSSLLVSCIECGGDLEGKCSACGFCIDRSCPNCYVVQSTSVSDQGASPCGSFPSRGTKHTDSAHSSSEAGEDGHDGISKHLKHCSQDEELVVRKREDCDAKEERSFSNLDANDDEFNKPSDEDGFSVDESSEDDDLVLFCRKTNNKRIIDSDDES